MCIFVAATGTAIIQKPKYLRVGPFPMTSGVIVKSGEKFRLDPDYKPAPLPLPLPLYIATGNYDCHWTIVS